MSQINQEIKEERGQKTITWRYLYSSKISELVLETVKILLTINVLKL